MEGGGGDGGLPLSFRTIRISMVFLRQRWGFTPVGSFSVVSSGSCLNSVTVQEGLAVLANESFDV
jgi:hypothetical protein